jgi:beta-glucanase (GH16 family)
MARTDSASGRRRIGTRLGVGVAMGLLVAAFVAHLSHPRPQLAQAAEEPTVDDCGTRPTKPVVTTTTPVPTTTTTVPTTTTTAATTTSSTSSTTTTTAPTTTTTEATTTSTEATTSTSVAPELWKCSAVEDFDGTSLDRDRWTVQTTTGGNFGVGGECFVDSPDNIAVSDGTLKLIVRKEATSSPCPRANNPGFATPFTAGSIISKPALDQAFGRYEIRARMPTGTIMPGLQFTFWLWPRDLTAYPPQFGNGDYDKWTNGELDAFEWYSRYAYHDVPYFHYAYSYVQTPAGKWVPDDPNITKACFVGDVTAWHTYAIEWTPTEIRTLYDGHVCTDDTSWHPRNTTMPGPFDKPFMVSLTQALGAIGTDNQYVAQTPLPGTAEIDYLKIWH